MDTFIDSRQTAKQLRSQAATLLRAAETLEGREGRGVRGHRRGRRRLSAAAKRHISQMMKKRWAERKRAMKKGPQIVGGKKAA